MSSDEPASAKVRKNITVPEDLYREFLSLGGEGESQRDLLSKLMTAYGGHVELQEELVSLRARCDGYESAITMLREENDVLQDGLDAFGKLGSRTAVVASGQSAIGDFGRDAVKDAVDAIQDVCDDGEVCMKTALHLLDKKADIVNKQLDRDHSSDEKKLDREDKEKDRALKRDLEERKGEHQRKLALIKKGIVDKSDLEDVIFLGSLEPRKTPGEMLAERKKQASHAAGDDDFEAPDDEYVVDDDDGFDGELVDDAPVYGGEGGE